MHKLEEPEKGTVVRILRGHAEVLRQIGSLRERLGEVRMKWADEDAEIIEKTAAELERTGLLYPLKGVTAT